MAAFLLAVSLQADEVRVTGTPPLTAPYRLRFQPPKQFDFRIHRIWRTSPQGSGNGDQTHEIGIRVFASGKDVGRLVLTVTQFKGHAAIAADSKWLPKIAGKVKNLRLSRPFTTGGVGRSWRFAGSNDAGWAGMMAAKACGLYEVGFLELSYPVTSVGIGSTWQAPIHVGNEGFEAGQLYWVKGMDTVCNYRLDSVDLVQKTATISFRAKAWITGSFNNYIAGRREALLLTEEQSGKWTVDMATGMPLTFLAKRTVIDAAKPSIHVPAQTETTETEGRRG
ncbi:MAG: hypothetical protein JSS72_02585 [Armatimonadetes bacterium]|nr:hypothetical protein [Armatimonadota bacterium]